VNLTETRLRCNMSFIKLCSETVLPESITSERENNFLTAGCCQKSLLSSNRCAGFVPIEDLYHKNKMSRLCEGFTAEV
jgi:hypothetical protein